MRILALAFEDVYHPTGGLGVHVRDLYREIGKLGHEVKVITIASEPPAYGVFQLCANVEVLKIDQKLTWQSDLAIRQHWGFEWNFLANVLEHYGRETFDLIHVHDSHLWPVAEALRLLWKIPVVLTCHLSPLLHEMRYQTDDLAEYKNQIEGTAICNADARISVSQYYHDELKCSLLGTESVVIQNGVDFEALQQYHRDDEVRAKYGTADRPLVCMVGRPVENKGVKLFMEASKWFPEHQFVYIGYLADTVEKHYPLAAELVKHVAETSNFTWVRHINHPDKYRLMASADIGVVPSLFEPFGIAALEWMALGVPLITTAVGGLGGFCNSTNCDIMQPTAAGLIDAISRHERDLEKLAEAELETACEYTWERAAANTIRVYEETINGHRN